MEADSWTQLASYMCEGWGYLTEYPTACDALKIIKDTTRTLCKQCAELQTCTGYLPFDLIANWNGYCPWCGQ